MIEALGVKVDYFATRPAGEPLILAIPCVGVDLARIEGHVSSEEKIRAARFRFVNDRKLYLVARATLRIVLGRIFQSNGVHVPLYFSDSGKPFLRNGPAFSISHSGGVVLVGFAWETEIGVDVEVLRAFPDIQSLATSCLAASELAELNRIDSVDQRAIRLLSFWTRKEAITKALGLGLALPFHSFSCLDQEGPRVIREEGAAVAKRQWSVLDWGLPASHIGAVAVAGPVQRYIRVTANTASFLLP